jgi:WD40 repeat protein
MKKSPYLIPILFFVLITGCSASGQQNDITTSMPSFPTPTQTIQISPTLALLTPSHTASPALAITASPEATATREGEMVRRCPDVVSQITYSPDSKLLAAACIDGIYLYDSQTLSLVHKMDDGIYITPMVVDFSPDGQILASGGNVNLYQVSDGVLLHTLSEQKYATQSISFSADGQRLAESSGNLINIWRVSNGVLLNTIDSHTYVTSLAFAPTGSTLAVGSIKISLWQTSNGTWLRNFTGHTDEITSVAFSPDGVLLASGSFDRTAKLWRVRNGMLHHTLEGATAPVSGVAFSPDGQILATSSNDGTVRLWQVSNGVLIRTLDNLTTHWVTSVAFSPDGKWLAAGTDDGKIWQWYLGE